MRSSLKRLLKGKFEKRKCHLSNGTMRGNDKLKVMVNITDGLLSKVEKGKSIERRANGCDKLLVKLRLVDSLIN